MASKMLIDAGHPEETRVVVIQGNRIEEFDYESSAKRQLRGNIYLAKVTRVEPSLQAAFVDYGGNRHGFLAFSEIHPDYYQIPVADRQALAEAMSEERDDEDGPADEGDSGRQTGNRRGSRRGRRGGRRRGSRAPVQAGDDGEENPAPIEPDQIKVDPIEADSVAADAAIGEASVSDFDTPADGIQNDFADLDAPDVSTAHDPLLAPSYGGEESQAETDIDASAGAAAAVSPEASDAERDGESAPDLAADGDPVIAPKALAQAPEPTLTSPEIEPIDPEPEVPETQDLHAHADEEAPEPEAEEDVLEHGTEIVSATGEDEGIWDSAVEQSQAFLARQDDEAADESGADEEDEDEEDDEAGEGRRYRRRSRQRASYRRYKIQEVIKKRQIMLVQVVKEERGNKGAALTTYLSLAGRYSVLMPNTGKGGGISRKITNPSDRKRLKEIAQDLDVPQGMGLIVRTAGANRTRAEIKRDYDYLLRLWESVRDLTLRSTAPTLVYEEGNLIKRTIRDLYSRDIDTVLVQGDQAYREAKDFMRMLMPSHAKNVQSYREVMPLFQRFKAEAQLEAMISPQVQLPSGGYIVINPTEALVAVDVNSGRATREHSIEDTALRTNLEAAQEIARQLRLRDLAGLIVIDFIDMEDYRNNRSVEKRLKEALKNDRARIQIGRISTFGLLEMSRQRLRTGVMEGVSTTCAHCQGAGVLPSIEAAALTCLRAIEAEAVRNREGAIVLVTANEVVLYLLNNKRRQLARIEAEYGVCVQINIDREAVGRGFRIDRDTAIAAPIHALADDTAIVPETGFDGHDDEDDEADDRDDLEARSDEDAEGDEGRGRKRRRRRRRRGRRDEDGGLQADTNGAEDEDAAEGTAPEAEDAGEDLAASGTGEDEDEDRPRRRRRGRRGGRRSREARAAPNGEANPETDEPGDGAPADAGSEIASEADQPVVEAAKPANGQADEAGSHGSGAETDPRSAHLAAGNGAESTHQAAPHDDGPGEDHAPGTVAPADEPEADEADDDALSVPPEIAAEQTKTPRNEPAKSAEPARRGWWQKKFFSE